MTNKEKLEANERKQELIAKRGCHCQVCGCPINYFTGQLAHRIQKGYVKIYGADIIHHPFNLVVTCNQCNDSVLMKPATQPIKAAELIQRIQEDLNEE